MTLPGAPCDPGTRALSFCALGLFFLHPWGAALSLFNLPVLWKKANALVHFLTCFLHSLSP